MEEKISIYLDDETEEKRPTPEGWIRCRWPEEVIEYLKPYLSPYCIFTKTDKTHLEEIKRCGMDYLTLYLDLLSQSEAVEDISYRDKIERAQKKYTHDLITHDPSRKMLGRIIGKKRADRIFKEVIV